MCFRSIENTQESEKIEGEKCYFGRSYVTDGGNEEKKMNSRYSQELDLRVWECMGKWKNLKLLKIWFQFSIESGNILKGDALNRENKCMMRIRNIY